MSRKYRCFLHLYDFQLPKQTRQKTKYLQFFDKTTCKETRCFEPIFTFFQLVLLYSKINHFLIRFSHCSSGLKKVLNHKKLLNCTDHRHFAGHNLFHKVVTQKPAEAVWAVDYCVL